MRVWGSCQRKVLFSRPFPSLSPETLRSTAAHVLGCGQSGSLGQWYSRTYGHPEHPWFGLVSGDRCGVSHLFHAPQRKVWRLTLPAAAAKLSKYSEKLLWLHAGDLMEYTFGLLRWSSLQSTERVDFPQDGAELSEFGIRLEPGLRVMLRRRGRGSFVEYIIRNQPIGRPEITPGGLHKKLALRTAEVRSVFLGKLDAGVSADAQDWEVQYSLDGDHGYRNETCQGRFSFGLPEVFAVIHGNGQAGYVGEQWRGHEPERYTPLRMIGMESLHCIPGSKGSLAVPFRSCGYCQDAFAAVPRIYLRWKEFPVFLVTVDECLVH